MLVHLRCLVMIVLRMTVPDKLFNLRGLNNASRITVGDKRRSMDDILFDADDSDSDSDEDEEFQMVQKRARV